MSGIYYPMSDIGLNIIKTKDGQQIQWGEQIKSTVINRGYMEGMVKLKDLYERFEEKPSFSLIEDMKKVRLSMY